MLKKKIIYALTIIYRVTLYSLAPRIWPWWNRIDESIILGGIPLKNKDHIDKIKEEGVLAVLTLLEKFEFEKKGLLSVPVLPEEWKREGVEYMHIEVADFSPLSLGNIERGVEYISQQVLQKKTVYVHCKAGRGRSAVIVICYLMKQKKMSPEEALEFVKGQRPLVKPNRVQMECIRQYYRHLD